MSPLLRNILAVIAGAVIGGIVNIGIITLGPNLIPSPEGVNPNDIESIKANVDLYGFKHFIVPFLAHALGTLVGAFVAVKIGISKHKTLAYIIGGLFFIGGAMMAFMIQEFWKFSIIDLLLAYFPMAVLGWSLAGKGGDNS
jgi:hypothetical protein